MRLLKSSILAVLVLALALVSVPFHANAQQDPAQPTQPTATEAQQQSQSFSGTIVKAGDDFVLRDEAGKTTYKLDNAEQAKQYEGKNVKVTGTMDPMTNTIHVERIELAGSE